MNELAGTFVVEVGERQAWPFLTFCDNRPERSREARLYIDTTFRLNGQVALQDPDESAVPSLLTLNNRQVEAVAEAAGELTIRFNGDQVLVVSSTPQPWTTSDIWWMSPWDE